VYRLDLEKDPAEDFFVMQVRLLCLVLASVVKKAYILPQPSLIFLDPALKKNVPATKPIIEPSKTSSMCSAIVGRFCKIFGIF
jgi:hypothetical protein